MKLLAFIGALAFVAAPNVRAQIDLGNPEGRTGNVGIGIAPESNSRLKVRNVLVGGTGVTFGIKGEAYPDFGQPSTTATLSVGVLGIGSRGTTVARGVQGEAGGSGSNQALHGYAVAESGQTAYGIYATAVGLGTRYAGYFAGNVTVTGTLTTGSFSTGGRSASPLDGGDVLGRLMQLRPQRLDVAGTARTAGAADPGPHYELNVAELRAAFPELVRDEVHLVRSGAGEGATEAPETFATVEVLSLIPVLVQAVQEQQAEIEALRAEVARLQSTR